MLGDLNYLLFCSWTIIAINSFRYCSCADPMLFLSLLFLFLLDKLFDHVPDTFTPYLFSLLLLQLELFLSSGTVCLSVYSLVAAIFGMNIPYPWRENHGYIFKWVRKYIIRQILLALALE